MKLSYPAIFYKNDETGAYAVEVPDLPGCATGGNSFEEAHLMGVDAAAGWVLSELEDGKQIPPASNREDIKPELGGFVNMIVLDMVSYSEKYGDKAVRKNLTIPAWLNTFAESQQINYSKVLQESLTELYHKQIKQVF